MFLSIAHLQEDETAHSQDAEAKCRYILCKYNVKLSAGTHVRVCMHIHTYTTYWYTVALAVTLLTV